MICVDRWSNIITIMGPGLFSTCFLSTKQMLKPVLTIRALSYIHTRFCWWRCILEINGLPVDAFCIEKPIVY